MAQEESNVREKFLASLAAAEVPDQLAIGILKVLLNAGYDKLQAPLPNKAPLLNTLSIEALAPTLLDQAHIFANGSHYLHRQVFWTMSFLAVRTNPHEANVEAASD